MPRYLQLADGENDRKAKRKKIAKAFGKKFLNIPEFEKGNKKENKKAIARSLFLPFVPKIGGKKKKERAQARAQRFEKMRTQRVQYNPQTTEAKITTSAPADTLTLYGKNGEVMEYTEPIPQDENLSIAPIVMGATKLVSGLFKKKDGGQSAIGKLFGGKKKSASGEDQGGQAQVIKQLQSQLVEKDKTISTLNSNVASEKKKQLYYGVGGFAGGVLIGSVLAKSLKKN